MARDTGSGSSGFGFSTRYYFNPITSQCETFSYAGSGGNANNFESLDQCQSYCLDCKCVPHDDIKPYTSSVSARQSTVLWRQDTSWCEDGGHDRILYDWPIYDHILFEQCELCVHVHGLADGRRHGHAVDMLSINEYACTRVNTCSYHTLQRMYAVAAVDAAILATFNHPHTMTAARRGPIVARPHTAGQFGQRLDNRFSCGHPVHRRVTSINISFLQLLL
jgi:hypothetical protein